jgi:ATP-dependent DNA helicase RecQ
VLFQFLQSTEKENTIIAAFAKNAQQHWQSKLNRIQSIQVIAMITRYKTDSEEQYQSRCKVDQWEIPMLEVVIG